MTTASTSRDALRIAVLLTLLFAIAAVAVRVTISVVEDIPGTAPETTALISFGILAITFAFMCIAGAVGVWAIRFSVSRESRRRVGRFVDELAAIHDGILTSDRDGKVIGSNPALRTLIGRPIKPAERLLDIFPCLSEADSATLLSPAGIQEIERTCQGTTLRTLRFRSQPAEDMHVLFVSDITHRRAEEQRREQIARFQLVGRIARGVAYDFNNLLCGISSHGSLLRRLRVGSEEAIQSATAITRDAERGITLSRHLMDLSHTGMAGQPTDRLDHYAERACELLRIGLSSAWSISMEAQPPFDPIALSGIQIEQVILNLGLLSADTLARPGVIRITVNKPGQDHLLNVNRSFAAVLILSASTGADTLPSPPPPSSPGKTEPESGIILSVVRTMVEECGGLLECFFHGSEQMLFRVLIPRAPSASTFQGESELAGFLSGLHILLAGRREITGRIVSAIGNPSDSVIHETADAVELLVKAEKESDLDVMIIDQRLIGHEPDAFLRALMKLRPQAGIVVLKDEHAVDSLQSRGVITIPASATPTIVAGAIIEAKGLAHRPR
jgi:nitrogen-specific signal transduction histidine kinase